MSQTLQPVEANPRDPLVLGHARLPLQQLAPVHPGADPRCEEIDIVARIRHKPAVSFAPFAVAWLLARAWFFPSGCAEKRWSPQLFREFV